MFSGHQSLENWKGKKDPADIYFIVNNGNNRATLSGVFIVKFYHISYIVPVFSLLNLNKSCWLGKIWLNSKGNMPKSWMSEIMRWFIWKDRRYSFGLLPKPYDYWLILDFLLSQVQKCNICFNAFSFSFFLFFFFFCSEKAQTSKSFSPQIRFLSFLFSNFAAALFLLFFLLGEAVI